MKIIELNHKQKIALLEAVQCGRLDLGIFDALGKEAQTERDIIAEIVRIEKMSNPGKLADLMKQWANGNLTDAEYIEQRLKL